MTKVADGTPEIQCLLEKVFLSIGFKVVHDGEQAHDFPDAGKPSFYTRTLRWYIDNKPVDTWIRFVYNLRTRDADLQISRRDLAEIERRLNVKIGDAGKNSSYQNGTTHVREATRKDDSGTASKSSAKDVEAEWSSPTRQESN